MAQLTQMQIAEKYDVTAPDVSVAIREGMVDPIGTVRGQRRDLKLYDEKQAQKAIADLYLARANRYYRKYQEWTEKAAMVRKVDSDA